jgi:ribosomal protein S18 acetylase RimI-like enzyme
MTDINRRYDHEPVPSIEFLTSMTGTDLNDLCDATDSAIQAGGGFGWVHLPARDILERYWHGVLTMPQRLLFVARLDGTICGAAQLILPPKNNEAQSFAATLTAHFIAPWARGRGLSQMLIEAVERRARQDGFAVINLDVRETQISAIRLYERMGYTLFCTHPCYARVNDKVIAGRYYFKSL